MEFWRFARPVGAGSELVGSYDPILVALSVTIACVSAFVALGAVRRMVEGRAAGTRRAWWALGAFSFGSGVWAVHFTGMLALRLPVTVTYALELTVVSGIPAVAGSAVALHVLSRDRRSHVRHQIGALCLAVGIGTMHFVGMEAMGMHGSMHYEPVLWLASIAMAYLLAMAALYANTMGAGRSLGLLRRLGAPMLMGLAVAAMHYIAMASARFHAGGESHEVHHVLPTGVIGVAISLFVLFLLSALLLFMWLDNRLSKAQDMVRDRVARLQVVLDTMPDGLITVDRDVNVEAMNVAAEAMFGVSEEAAVGRPVTDFLSTRSCSPSVSGSTHRAIGLHSDGSTFPLDMKSAVTRAGDREITTLVVRDMTESRAAEERLHRLATAVEQSSEAIAITDAGGHVNYVNPAFTEVTGYSADEVRGLVPDVLLAEHTTPEFHEHLWRMLRSGHVWKGSYVNHRKDGSAYETEASITPLRDETGAVTSFIEVRRDVSEQHEMSRQLARAQKLESIGQLASGIAHEINTPTQYVGDNVRFLKEAFAGIARLLGVIDIEAAAEPGRAQSVLAEASLVAREIDLGYLVSEMPSAFDQAIDGVGRIAGIVSAMKDFSHPSHEKMPCDVNGLIRSTVTVTRHEWKYVAEVDLELDDAMPPVPCIPAELNQALINIVVNAAHAIGDRVKEDGEGGRITFRTRVVDDEAEIVVEDTGAGIPEHIIGRIFDPFFTTKEVGKGTGQGLTIVHQIIVETHGGSISVDSEPGSGTRFTIRLPVAAPAMPGSDEDTSAVGNAGDGTAFAAAGAPHL